MQSIGRALTTQPSLVVLDEATEGLAPQIVAEMWRVIDAPRAHGMATLIVDRGHRRVAAHATWLLVPVKGRVAPSGRAAELHDTPALRAHLGV